MNEEIKAKIIKFISAKTVVINKGKNHRIKEDMIFGIKLILPDIVDPDDNTNILSGIFYEKGEVRIETVFDKMSFASLIPKYSYSLSFLGIKPDKDWNSRLSGIPLLSDEDWKIKVGDEVYLKKEKEESKKE